MLSVVGAAGMQGQIPSLAQLHSHCPTILSLYLVFVICLFVCLIAFTSCGMNMFIVQDFRNFQSLNHCFSPCHLVFVVGRRRPSPIWAAGVQKKKRAERTNKGLAGHRTARRDTAEETKGYEINFALFFSLSLSLSLAPSVVGCQLLSLDDSNPLFLSPFQMAGFSRAS